MELGQTQDPVDLIPGSVTNARFGAAEWRKTAARAEDTRAAFSRLDDDGTWSGTAYDRYVERFEQQLSYWRTTSDTFTTAANALENYAGALEWAQGEAATAIRLWNQAEAQAAAAWAEHRTYVRSLQQGPGAHHLRIDVPFDDPSGPARQDAQEVLANARYQLDALATGYANVIGEAADAAPLPLTPEQAEQARTDLIVRTAIDVAVVKPFQATLNYLGAVAQNLWEHPDIVLEMLGGILGIVGGGATIIGGGGLELATVGVGTPVAVPAVIAGAGIAAGGAALLSDSMNRMLNEANTGGQRGIDRGDGRDTGGRWTKRDPDAPPIDHKLKEQQGLDDVEEAVQQAVIRDKLHVDYPGSPQNGRFYDGLYRNPDGTYTGVEVKSGGAYDDYLRPGNTQRQFDSQVSTENPAVGYLNGEEIKIVKVRVVPIP